jgi:hypothetical protein
VIRPGCDHEQVVINSAEIDALATDPHPAAHELVSLYIQVIH